MSWSVNASGKVEEVIAGLDKQFSYPLADAPAGLSDEGERETVRLVAGMIEQCLGTFHKDRIVSVTAYGYMGFDSWETKEGAYQNVHVSIQV